MSHPIGYYAGNFEQLKILEDEIGGFCRKLTQDQRNKTAGALLSGTGNPGTVSPAAWEVLQDDPQGFAKALLDG